MDPILAAAALVTLAAVVAVAAGAEVRLTLLGAALALGTLAGDAAAVIRTFLDTFSNERYVVPICTAMGFAHVLKHTGCDGALVRLLMAPVRRVRALLVPGAVLVGFLVNIPVVSQTSTAVCLGTVVVPVLRAAGLSPVTTGAALLMGASIGGELLNPGAPELLTIQAKTGIDTREMPAPVARFLFPHVVLAVLILWGIEARLARRAGKAVDAGPVPAPEPWRWRELPLAAVPVVPLALLLTSGPPLHWLTIPPTWVVPPGGAASLLSTRLVGLAMLVGVLAAGLAVPRRAGGCLRAFFEGAGFGFTHVVSLIVTANCFGKAVEQAGLTRPLAGLIADAPALLHPLAAVVSCGFAVVCGSGMATTQSLYGLFHDAAPAGEDPLKVGATVSVAAAAGRTLSPVAAVVLMCATLTGAKPAALLWRLAPPLLAALAAATTGRALGWV